MLCDKTIYTFRCSFHEPNVGNFCCFLLCPSPYSNRETILTILYKLDDQICLVRWWSTQFLTTIWAFSVQKPNKWTILFKNATHNNFNGSHPILSLVWPRPRRNTMLENKPWVCHRSFWWEKLCSRFRSSNTSCDTWLQISFLHMHGLSQKMKTDSIFLKLRN